MGILSGLFSAVATVTKAIDDFAEHSGAPPVIKSATASLRHMGESMAASAEPPSEGVGAQTHSESRGFLSGVASLLGGSSQPAMAVADTPKLGRSAHHYNGVVSAPAVQDPFHADFNSIQVPQVQNLVAQQVSAGVNV